MTRDSIDKEQAILMIGQHIYDLLTELAISEEPGLLTNITINDVTFGLTIEREGE